METQCADRTKILHNSDDVARERFAEANQVLPFGVFTSLDGRTLQRFANISLNTDRNKEKRFCLCSTALSFKINAMYFRIPDGDPSTLRVPVTSAVSLIDTETLSAESKDLRKRNKK